MAKNRKCLNCKKYKLEVNSIKCNFGYFCCNDCRVKYATNNSKELLKKETKNRHIKEKKQHQYSDLKIRKYAAKKACHDYIKARDNGLNCICCNKPINKQVHAGHFIESGNYPFLRYNEYNINSQRAYCNTYKGGDSGSYEKNLRLKIGNDKVDYLLENKNKSCKRSVDDYVEIELYYKNKIKTL